MSNAFRLRMPGWCAFPASGQCGVSCSSFGTGRSSAIPPDATPYMTGQYIMNTDRLKKSLGSDYERVIAMTNAEAFADGMLPIHGH